MKKTDLTETQPLPALSPKALEGSSPPQADSTSRPPGSRPSLTQRDDFFDEECSSRKTETAIEVPPQLRERNRAALRVITGLNAGQVFPLEGRDIVLGRGRDADVRLDDAGVSRRHSRVSFGMDHRFMIEDLGSTNGTYVAGTRVARRELHSGDTIQIGPNVEISFVLLDETEERLARALYDSSTRDALTQAYNRKYFAERLAAEVAYAIRHASKLSVVLFDIDHFKLVNDTYGHLAGDAVLRAVAAQVAGMIRVEDLFARYGGEEFVLLARGLDHENAARFAERVRRGIEKLRVVHDGQEIRVTTSAGVAALSEIEPERLSGAERRSHPELRAPTGEELLLRADERLYRAKESGRNRVES